MTLLNRQFLEQECGGREKLSEATTLNLSRKGITSIAAEAFTNLPNVKEIFLDKNLLTHIAEGSFDGLTSLETIWLFENKISQVAPRAFASLPNLKHLSLGINQLEKLPDGAFDGLANLEMLWLNQNKISELSPKAFESLPRLKVLSFWKNQLSSIPEGVFDSLVSLEELYLHENKISKFVQEHFDGLKSIKVLRVDENLIEPSVLPFYDGSSFLQATTAGKPDIFISQWEKFFRQFPTSKDRYFHGSIFDHMSKPKRERPCPFAESFACPICSGLLKEPVSIPCGHSVCKSHQEGLAKIDCFKCQRTFDIPQEGFIPSLVVQEMLARGAHEIDLGQEFTTASKECDNFEDVVLEIKALRDHSDSRVQEAVSELRVRVDLRREELKLKIDQEAIELIKQLDDYENKFQTKAKQLLSQLDPQIAAWEDDLKNWKAQLESFSKIKNKWKEIGVKSKARLAEGRAALKRISEEIFSDDLGNFIDRSSTFGANELYRGRTLTLLVDNLRKKLETKRSQEWKSEPNTVLGIDWSINVSTYWAENKHHVDVFLVGISPLDSKQVKVNFEIVISSGREKKQIAEKSASQDFFAHRFGGIRSMLEIHDPIENDPIFTSEDSFNVQVKINKIELHWI